MEQKKKAIYLSIISVAVVFIILLVFSIFKIIENNRLKEGSIDIVISQKLENNETNVLFRDKFTDDLELELIVYSKISNGNSNTVIIKDGVCKVINTTCPTHTCEGYQITNKSSIFDSGTTISCLPNGLFITIESSK